MVACEITPRDPQWNAVQILKEILLSIFLKLSDMALLFILFMDHNLLLGQILGFLYLMGVLAAALSQANYLNPCTSSLLQLLLILCLNVAPVASFLQVSVALALNKYPV